MPGGACVEGHRHRRKAIPRGGRPQRESKLTLESIDPNIPVFRTSVQQTPLKLEDYWKITKGVSNIKRGRIKRQIEAELKAIEANHAAPEDSQEAPQPEDAKKPRTEKPQFSDVPR